MGTLQKCVFLLIALVVSAEEEDFLSQREDLLDLSILLGEDFFTQKEVPLEDHEFEREAPQLPGGPPRFGPRSMGFPQIPFPLARPKSNNIQAICRYSKQRPRYPKESLPRSGYGYLVRQANAVNQLESWLSVCCRNGNEDEELTLCCAEQAWKTSLSAFCDEEFSIKTSHYHCCKEKGSRKWACFEKEAPDQSYQPSSHGSWADLPSMSEDFSFNPTTCQKKGLRVGPRALKGRVTAVMDTFFPHGRPNSDNIGSICTNRKHRRQFFSRCLPRKGDSMLTQKAKAINELEKGINQCCKKKERQACAEMKWKMMVDEFCINEEDLVQFACCEKDKGEKLYNCFAAAAPNPDYIPLNESMSVSQARPTLDMFCDMYSTYHTMQRLHDVSLEIFAGKMAKQCCPPEEERNSACLQTELDNIVDEVCADKFWRSHSCCRVNPKSRAKCVTKHVLDKLAEGNSQNYNNWKKCPVFS